MLTGYSQFDSKAKVESYIRDLPITSAFYWPGFFMQMTTNMFKPKVVSTSSPLLLIKLRLTKGDRMTKANSPSPGVGAIHLPP